MSANRDSNLYSVYSADTPKPVISSITFIVPVRNDANRLKRCLQSLAFSKLPAVSIEMVVVDNGSTDASREVARAAGAVVLELPGLRVGALRNRGAQVARGNIL